MRQSLFRGIALMAVPVLVTILWATSAGALTTVTACGTPLTKAGEVYKVGVDLISCGTCLTVANNRITVNLQGHSITGTCGNGAGVSDGGVARDLTVVRDGSISGFEDGVDLSFSTRSQVLNITASGNFFGIFVGPNGLVKSSSATGNVVGIAVLDHGQVQQSNASLNSGTGIFASDHCLITQNTANGNGNEGISTGGSCTVSFNTANDNADDGIDIGNDGQFEGTHSLITSNTANNNGDVGIEVPCPSTVTFNSAAGNSLNYSLFGTPACDAHNNTSGGPPTN